MGVIKLTTRQLDELQPASEWFFEGKLAPTASSSPNMALKIETREQCMAEDKLRVAGFQAFDSKFSVMDDDELPFDPYWTLQLLQTWSSGEQGASSTASATYLRDRRLSLAGSILKLIYDNPALDHALVTITCPGLQFDLRKSRWEAEGAHNWMMRDFLCESGLSGFCILYLYIFFDIQKKCFRGRYHGICAGNKLTCLISRQDCGRAASAPRAIIHPVSNLRKQILGMIPNPISTPTSDGSPIPGWGTWEKGLYLLQMGSNISFADLCIFDGACLQGGQLIMVDS